MSGVYDIICFINVFSCLTDLTHTSYFLSGNFYLCLISCLALVLSFVLSCDFYTCLTTGPYLTL